MISNLFLLFFAEKGMAMLCLFHFFIFSGFLSDKIKRHFFLGRNAFSCCIL